MYIPASTYRLQLSPAFTLEDVSKIVDYLEDFQISTVYAAPFFQSMEGSMHGYDVTDPFKINDAIGDLETFRKISAKLKQKGIGWLQDIVPNHMANHPSNPWIFSILEHGPKSEFYNYFDIDWKYKEWEGKVMVPTLGNHLETVLDQGEIQLKFDSSGFSLHYFDHNYPLSANSYLFILEEGKKGSSNFPGIEKFKNPPSGEVEWKNLKTDLYQTYQDDPKWREDLNAAIKAFNSSRSLMGNLLDQQHFRLVHWKDSEKKINFRRFFTINDLICLRMEDEKVFRAYHTFILQMCKEGLISGLRIDHIDGLFDPKQYLERLSEALGEDFYIIIEKILEWDEDLPKDWAMQGTSGYHFLAIVNNLFTATKHESLFQKEYQKLNPEIVDYEQLVYDKKSFILHERMGGELQNLWNLLIVSELLPVGEGFNQEKGIQALSAFLAAFPVYRIYPDDYPLNNRQQRIVDETYETAKSKESDLKRELEYFHSLFSGKEGKNPEKMLYFLQRCQQFTGPLAAKGVEDTSFYIYNRLISHNEVGDTPKIFGISVQNFHDLMIQRSANFPLSINATATHDTKRGEDARMRINVLSEIPEEWFRKVEEWQKMNQHSKISANVPDKNEEYFIYQSLIGAMAFGEDMEEDFLSRTHEYLLKVLREAKVHTFWSDPDIQYEKEVEDFVKNILENKTFLDSFVPFKNKIAFYGVLNSLTQSLLKVTAPGIPDIYQGSELWDLSYVDPDNRRPVDYDLRISYLEEFESFPQGMSPNHLVNLMNNYADGRIKMYTLYRALKERKLNQDLFTEGAYDLIRVSGDNESSVVSYARHDNNQWYIVVVPLGTSAISKQDVFPLGDTHWGNGQLHLPDGAPTEWINAYTGENYSSNGTLALNSIFTSFPVALLKSREI